jgi:hypothetical protein
MRAFWLVDVLIGASFLERLYVNDRIGVYGRYSEPESGLEPLTPCLQDRCSTS